MILLHLVTLAAAVCSVHLSFVTTWRQSIALGVLIWLCGATAYYGVGR